MKEDCVLCGRLLLLLLCVSVCLSVFMYAYMFLCGRISLLLLLSHEWSSKAEASCPFTRWTSVNWHTSQHWPYR